MNKKLIYVVLFLFILLVTFFGLGPVLYADGTDTERMITLIIVIALYLLLFIAFYIVHKRWRK